MNSEQTLHAGDSVRSRNGGPEMTVEAATEKFVFCTWTDTHGHVLGDTFPRCALDRLDGERGGAAGGDRLHAGA
jgi:uncharacterized protein YodC (DUF2158 family)